MMDNDEKTYGRRRVKKTKPAIEIPKTDIEPPLEIQIPPPEIQKPAPEIEKPVGNAQIQSPARRPEPVGSENGKAPEARRPVSPREKSRRPDDQRPRSPRERERTPDRTRHVREAPKPFVKAAAVRVSIIVPAYDEKENVEPLLKQFDEVLRKFNDWEVVYVDDGSTDGTGKIARQAMARYHWLKVISHNRNKGLTAALETGFGSARGSVFVFYPADLQYHPQDIPRMIDRIDRGADLVTGWKQGKYKKKFVSLVYNRICRILFGIKVHDLNSVKAFKKEILDNITMRRDWHRYMVVFASENNLRIDEVKVTLYPRTFGKSKFGAGRILGGVLDLFSVKFQISFMKSPLRFFGTWGFLVGGAGFIVGLIAVYLRFFTTHGSRTFLYLVILLVLSGLGLFALGFLAEVMVGLRDEINALKKRR